MTTTNLSTLILDLHLEVKELRMQVKRMDKEAQERHALIVQLLTSDKSSSVSDRSWEEVDMPADIADILRLAQSD